MSGSSSTISRLGFAFSAMSLDAFQEGALKRRFAVALAQSARRADVGGCPQVQDDHVVANFLDVGERVGGKEDGPAIRLELQKQVLRAHARSCVQAAHRLVEDVQIASGKKTGGKPELLGHALGVRAHGLPECGGFQKAAASSP